MEHKSIPSRRVGIVGLGLIGGSLALDLQALGWQVHGLVHTPSNVEKGLARGLAQTISTDPKILAECELIILALPLEELLSPSQELIHSIPPTAVITDVGSVKTPVQKIWTKLHKNFVPSHPMAGTSSSGIEAGQLGLFKNKPWVVTPDNQTNPTALEKIHQLANSLGSVWVTTEAKMHDEAVALISHLPVLISATLLRTLGEERNPALLALTKALASTGFEDTTRVGGGNPNMGTAMMSTNTAAVMRALSSYRWCLAQFEEAIMSEHWAQLEADFQKAQALRPDFIKKQLK